MSTIDIKCSLEKQQIAHYLSSEKGKTTEETVPKEELEFTEAIIELKLHHLNPIKKTENTDQDSNDDDNDNSDFEVRTKNQSSECSDDSDNTFEGERDTYEENFVEGQFEKVKVKSYTSITIKEEPVDSLKDVFHNTLLQFEKQQYHRQICEQVVKTCEKMTLEDLQEQYLNHLHEASNIEIFTCSLCKYETINLTNLKCHLLVIHNGKMEFDMFKCNICCYKSIYKSRMVKHMVKHKKIVKEAVKKKSNKNNKNKKKKAKLKKYPCSTCNFEAISETKLKKHQSTHNKERSNLCDLCTFESNDVEVLQKHKDTHKEGKKFLCYMCSYRITNKATLGRHLQNIHKIANEASKRSKMCEICSFTCSSRHQLKIHHLTHQNITDLKEDEIYKCSECSYQTKYKSNYKKHLLMHKDPELICEICGFATRHKRSYEYHLITHKKLDEIDWFRCDICPYQARNKKLLHLHKKKGNHSGKRLLHVRNRDRIREAEEKGEPIESVIKKYGIKKINGVPVKRERAVRQRAGKSPKRKRRPSKKNIKSENESVGLDEEGGVNFGFFDLAALRNEVS